MFFIKNRSRIFFIFNFLFLFFIFDISKADTNNFTNSKSDLIGIEYLESKNELQDYMLDTGDAIYLDIYPASELNGVYSVNEEGELFLPKLDETYVRGLTTNELEDLLKKRYSEFLVESEIKVRIKEFKPIRVLVRGELRNPGRYTFPAYTSGSQEVFNNEIISNKYSEEKYDSDANFFAKDFPGVEALERENNLSTIEPDLKLNFQSSENVSIKSSKENIITISKVIRKAGGITSSTDLSRIEVLRDIPLGKGGGKKRAIINFKSYLDRLSLDTVSDLRIFDGDILTFSKLSKPNKSQIPKSILSGISPKFINVNLFGRVDDPGIVRLPLEATLSDAIDISGPIKPLSGKVILIRYEKDGTVIKKRISYSSNAKRGSRRNPYLMEDDLITVKNSFLGKSTDVIKEFTAPFIGIYSTKELIEGFSD